MPYLLKKYNGKYAVSLVAREDNKNSKKIQDLTKAMTSEKVKKFIEEKICWSGILCVLRKFGVTKTDILTKKSQRDCSLDSQETILNG